MELTDKVIRGQMLDGLLSRAMPIDQAVSVVTTHVPDGCADAYLAAGDWWPSGEDVPAMYSQPSIANLTWGAVYPPNLEDGFGVRLRAAIARTKAWCIEVRRDPASPNATPAERRTIQLREAQRRYRADQQLVVADEVAALRAAKEEVKVTRAHHDEIVRQAHLHFMAVCAERRAALADANIKRRAAEVRLRSARSAD